MCIKNRDNRACQGRWSRRREERRKREKEGAGEKDRKTEDS